MTGEGAAIPVEDWGLARRVAFRFAFAYFALYFAASVLGYLPWSAPALAYLRLWRAFVPWIGEHVLSLAQKITVFPLGSGDTTYNYVEVLTFLALALGATLLWSLVDRRSRHYRRLDVVLRFVLRFVVGATLIGYGMAKVIPTQFPHPGPERLQQAYGDSSPMGLLWTFMGFSTGYNLFAGAAETLGGLLLFYRRTTTLGALILVGVMANVVALNFFFDVPVKLYSAHLLLASAFLALPDAGRLWNVLLANRATLARPRARWKWRWAELLRPWVATAYLAWLLYGQTSQALELRRQFGGGPSDPLHGLYSVVGFSRDNEELPETDPARWKQVQIAPQGFFLATTNGGRTVTYRYRSTNAGAALTLLPATGVEAPASDAPGIELESIWNDETHLDLAGELEGALIVAQLEKRTFLLETRGFHWINETPFNR
jgi:hypothetical protein